MTKRKDPSLHKRRTGTRAEARRCNAPTPHVGDAVPRDVWYCTLAAGPDAHAKRATTTVEDPLRLPLLVHEAVVEGVTYRWTRRGFLP